MCALNDSTLFRIPLQCNLWKAKRGPTWKSGRSQIIGKRWQSKIISRLYVWYIFVFCRKSKSWIEFCFKIDFFLIWHISPVLGLAVVCMPGNHEYNSKNLFDLDCSDSHAIYDRDNLWYLRCCDQQLNYKGLIIMPILQSCCGVSSFLSDLQSNHYLFPDKSYLVFLVSVSTLDLSQGSLRSASLTTAYLSIVISLAGTTGGWP